jgi:hypothetical protein
MYIIDLKGIREKGDSVPVVWRSNAKVTNVS